ncbi:MAG TPA: glycosyltransferase [Gemmatimonadales bacterium]|nr:glycosyltransferase [Gemmatimonadales bacterium]
MRVLTVTNMWPRRERPAFGAFVQSQVESIEALGVEVALHVIAGDRGAASYALDVPAVRAAVRRLRPDVVHAHYGLSGWTAQWQPMPLVVSFCGDDLLGTPARGGGRTFKSGIAMRMSQAAARKAAAIVCKSRNLAEALERPEDRARAHIIPNGVNLMRFMPGDRDAARRALGLDPAELLVLFPHAPQQAEQKGFDLADAVMERVRAAEPSARLLHVTGVPHSHMPDYYRAADCLLLTSKSEGSPNVVKEALACALPVVGVDAGDAREWLLRVPGCRLTERRAEPLAAAVLDVLRERARVDAAPVLAELDERAVARRIRAVYEQALGKAS